MSDWKALDNRRWALSVACVVVQVDLGSLLFPLLLRRRFLGHLGKEVLSLKSVLRCNWIPPNLAGVKVILPPESKALGVIGCIRHKLYPVSQRRLEYICLSNNLIISASASRSANRSARLAAELHGI